MVTVVRSVLVGFGRVVGGVVLLPLGPVIACIWAAKWLTPAEVDEMSQHGRCGQGGMPSSHDGHGPVPNCPQEARDVLADSWSGAAATGSAAYCGSRRPR